VTKPYEGYTGLLILPQEVVDKAAERSLLVDFRTPRAQVLEAICATYQIEPAQVHVWTLGGKSRQLRLGELWKTWRDLGVHLIEDGWTLPSGLPAFTDSGTYAPTYAVGFREGQLFLVDGYAASAEALQSASLAPVLGLDCSMAIFTSSFALPVEQEMRLPGRLAEAAAAGLAVNRPILRADDFFAEKQWDVLALASAMGADPYSGLPGVEAIDEDTYLVSVRLASPAADKRLRLRLRLKRGKENSRAAFQPLLNRFLAGEDYLARAVKISDSGRIRNELQTLCAEALEFPGEDRIRVHFERIPPTLIADTEKLRAILSFYRQRHPIWFRWLEF
jgi:hypothetical protein